MTLIVGYIWGRRYTRLEVLSVSMLTIGVILAAMADAQSKVIFARPKNDPSFPYTKATRRLACSRFGKDTTPFIMNQKPRINNVPFLQGKTSTSTSNSTPLTGLLILFVAQLLSAIMGLYVQATYATYGSHWHENLFYSHFLALPLFLPFRASLLAKFHHLTASPAFTFSPTTFTNGTSIPALPVPVPVPTTLVASLQNVQIPTHILSLILNALTQYICIRGVNLLAAQTSALGVTVVLNLRKLVSLFISIWVFGNKLPPGVVVGAAVVFGSVGLWGWEGQRKGRRERERVEAEQRGEKEKGKERGRKGG